MPEALATSSWDDGAVEDLRLAELLHKYAVPACFYVPRSNPERPVLEAPEIAELAKQFEIGGHTLQHRRLTSLPLAEARDEIHGCKHWLEDLTGQTVRSFCYPGGLFHSAHAREVERAGFENARTADWMVLDPGADPYRIAPSLHLYAHSPAVHVAHCVRRNHPRDLARYVLRFGCRREPAQLARKMLAYVAKHGGVFHVWGHSWEIAEHGLWDQLEATLRAMSEQPGITLTDNASVGRHVRSAAGR